MSIKGMQASLKGVQLLQGGAVVSSAPTKLTIHSVRLVCLVGALLALASGKAERRQVHPLSMHFCLVGALETSAPPEYALLFGWCT